MRVSVVVPVLQEERAITRVLDHLAAVRGVDEVIVADGGSTDATVARARAHPLGARVLDAPRGRARQMNAAAAEATGEVLVFLHADTRLPPGGLASVRAAVVAGAAGGNFRLRFDGPGAFPHLLGLVYAAQRRLGTFYGDSVIWMRADVFRALGGYPAIPVMEDYEMARMLRRAGRTRCLPGPAVTSSRRWRRLGIPRTVASWVVIRWLHVAGVPAERLSRLYRPAR